MTGPMWTVAIAAIAGLLAFVAADRPVDRRRLASFTGRHRVAVTAANAAHLVRYLAVTRRWRVAGVVTGLTLSTVDGLQHQSLGVNIGYGLSGWFAGALLAEARLAAPPSGQRVASLRRRDTADYVAPAARYALAAAATLCLIVAAATVAGSALRLWLVPLLAGLDLTAVVMVVARRVAVRPQPTTEPDVVAADDAIRTNSLRALYAAAVTLMLYAATGPIVSVVVVRDAGWAAALILATAVGIPLLGWRLGRAGAPAVRPVPDPAT